MRERRKGPIGRAADIAEGVAATVRRMQREREPRVLVYDETGYARLVQPNGRGYEHLLETAERMVAMAEAADAASGSRRTRRAESGSEPKPRRVSSDRPAKSPRVSSDRPPKSRRAGSDRAAKSRRRPEAGS